MTGREWTRDQRTTEAPPRQVLADRVELGDHVADELDRQQGAWWDLLEGER